MSRATRGGPARNDAAMANGGSDSQSYHQEVDPALSASSSAPGALTPPSSPRLGGPLARAEAEAQEGNGGVDEEDEDQQQQQQQQQHMTIHLDNSINGDSILLYFNSDKIYFLTYLAILSSITS